MEFTGRTERSADVNLRTVAFIRSDADLGFEVFTDGQFDTVFSPSKHLAVARSVNVQTVRRNKLKSKKGIDVTLY
jgi:hypothetical protein